MRMVVLGVSFGIALMSCPSLIPITHRDLIYWEASFSDVCLFVCLFIYLMPR
ncbi:hypothetical protein F4680DRAFT_405365, partial [Xylaria scruposa]